MPLRSRSLHETRIVRHETQRGCSVCIARAVRYARVLRIGPEHRGALMTRAETSSPERGNEFLLSVELDRLGQREREREREKIERERERERACVSVCPGFFLRTTTEGRARVRSASGRREPRVRGAWRCKNATTRPGLEPGISGSGGRHLIVLRATQSG